MSSKAELKMAPARAGLGALIALAAVGFSCTPAPTGILVAVHLGDLQLDELRFEITASPSTRAGVVVAPGRVVVEPTGKGRVRGPFFGGDETQPIVLPDDLGGRAVSCAVTGYLGDVPVAFGRTHARVLAGNFAAVDVAVEPSAMTIETPNQRPPRDGAPLDPPPDAASGTGGILGTDAGTGGSTPGTGSGGAGGTGSGGTGSGGAGGTGSGGNGGTPETGSGGAGGGAPPPTGSGGSGGTAPPTGSGGAGGSPPPDPDRPSPKALGALCGAAAECASGHCVDGVCCSGSCAGPCRACNLPGSVGQCVNGAPGARDPRAQCRDRGRSSCDSDGSCDGNGGCAFYPVGTVCLAASCDKKNLFPASTCDGAGACIDHERVRCEKQTMCVDGACR